MSKSEKDAIKKVFSVIGWIILFIPILFFMLVKALLAGFGYKK